MCRHRPPSASLSSDPQSLHSFPTRRSSDLLKTRGVRRGRRLELVLNGDAFDFLRVIRLPDTPRREVEGDRKSTRLNSSHSQISYAVFCSKTKTTTKSTYTTPRVAKTPIATA